jgi:hyperosmotically inducible periplasmic protein
MDLTLLTWNAFKECQARDRLRMEQEDEGMQWLRGGQRWMGTLLVIGLLVGCASTPEKRSTGEVIDDTTITTKVKANLLADPMVSSFAISVETSRGVVSLTGIVNSTGERAQAIQVAQETGGVRRVDARNLFIKQ